MLFRLIFQRCIFVGVKLCQMIKHRASLFVDDMICPPAISLPTDLIDSEVGSELPPGSAIKPACVISGNNFLFFFFFIRSLIFVS